MISQLKDRGYAFDDPWEIVTCFEKKLAKYSGSKHAVCLDSCSNSIFLCLKYLDLKDQTIEIPKNTYASVPMQIIHSGNNIRWREISWEGEYYIGNTPIIDGATRFRKNMYKKNSYYCVSFHHRKTLKIGRGGVILTDDDSFVDWARPMIYDGRNKNISYKEDQLSCIGYHMYMTPEDAAIGIMQLDELPEWNPDTGSDQTYPDLSLQPVFDNYCK
jgi:dTDP-4-amino-4,6-dideoxygalactose transaminase